MTILIAWLLADFLSGVVHFIEDRFFTDSTMHIFGSLNADNEMHHTKPTAMLAHSWWGNINTSAVFTLPLTALLYYLEVNLVITLAVFFGTFANLVHRFAHTPRSKVPAVVRGLQYTGLFISHYQHGQHHYERGLLSKEKAYRRYCPMTSWLNPILDSINFWYLLERAFKR